MPINEQQFDCGPAVPPLPEQTELQTWNPDELLDYGIESWTWGERCMIVNTLNRHYFMCALQNDQTACTSYRNLVARIAERRNTNAPSQ